jgi:hypothetical protein
MLRRRVFFGRSSAAASGDFSREAAPMPVEPFDVEAEVPKRVAGDLF